MHELKVLVRKAVAVNRLAAAAIATRKVATLDHKVFDDAVELASLVALGAAALREFLKVGRRLGRRFAVEAHDDAADRLAAVLNVEEHLVGDLGIRMREGKHHGGAREQSKDQRVQAETEHEVVRSVASHGRSFGPRRPSRASAEDALRGAPTRRAEGAADCSGPTRGHMNDRARTMATPSAPLSGGQALAGTSSEAYIMPGELASILLETCKTLLSECESYVQYFDLRFRLEEEHLRSVKSMLERQRDLDMRINRKLAVTPGLLPDSGTLSGLRNTWGDIRLSEIWGV